MSATNIRPRTFATSVDLPAKTREAMVDLCNQQLADSLDLYSQAKQAHWNVKGKDFFQLHALFDALATNVLGHVDLIAERATALGGYATGTARMAAATSALPEYPSDAVDGPDHVRALVERFAAYAASTREAIDAAADAGDQSTADMFTEVSRQTDKDLWFLEAHLQG
ncbi:MAG: starvation-inducible DNA-binding protein [Thermomicrobiales bacterium]|jgi:starvation-inducible DNA-binding protein|nr:starvation-inducible DNA-binding protein [Thermomicrobiales bacterium]MEA2586143.1 starvation-inducible DNA-binding protein [Thermomicrobiales bacterium]